VVQLSIPVGIGGIPEGDDDRSSEIRPEHLVQVLEPEESSVVGMALAFILRLEEEGRVDLRLNGGTGTLYLVDPRERLIVVVFVPSQPLSSRASIFNGGRP
jgi:hypothetical protein